MNTNTPSIKTTVVGSYPVPNWLHALPSTQALKDAIMVILKTQELAGLDVIADGELSETKPRVSYKSSTSCGLLTSAVEVGSTCGTQ